jgi:hypothetical protein
MNERRHDAPRGVQERGRKLAFVSSPSEAAMSATCHTHELIRFEQSGTPYVSRPALEPTNRCAVCRNKGGCGPCIVAALKGYGLTEFRS